MEPLPEAGNVGWFDLAVAVQSDDRQYGHHFGVGERPSVDRQRQIAGVAFRPAPLPRRQRLPAVNVRLSRWTCGLSALVAYNTAYFAEILRGAWAHLPYEQEEAGRAYGYAGLGLYRRIILPQIFIAASPILGNQMITLVKNSAFLMVITIPDLTFMANQVQAIYFVPLETMLVAVALYWVICSAIEWTVRRMDRVAVVRGHE